jgi:D-amino peptidase
MRLLISCDMEGISGIVDWEQVTPGKAEWERGRELMAGDANAAINGAFVGGAEAVTVADAHWHNRSLKLEALDPRAHLNTGRPSPFAMIEGIEAGDGLPYDALACVGYHAMAGAKKAVLCHTWSDKVRGVWLNGVAVGEIGLNAATAAHFGLPVIAVAGDQAACREAQDLLGGDVEIAAVKMGSSRYAAECLPLAEAREKICEAVARAVTRWKGGERRQPFRVASPVQLSVEFQYPHHADGAYLLPGATRTSGTRLEMTFPDMITAMRAFRAVVSLAGE